MSINKLTVAVVLALVLGESGDLVRAERSSPPAQGRNQGKSSPAKPGMQSDAQRASSRREWWSNDASKKELGLTADQAKTLDQIFTSTKDELAGYYEAMRREVKEAERLINESKVERWVVARQIDKSETARSSFNKLRLMTLYRMHQVLTPEQRVKLQAMLERDRRDPRKHP